MWLIGQPLEYCVSRKDNKMLTRKTKHGYTIPSSCLYENGCENILCRHCNDCAFVGRDYILEMIQRLNQYEEIGLCFNKNEDQNSL